MTETQAYVALAGEAAAADTVVLSKDLVKTLIRHVLTILHESRNSGLNESDIVDWYLAVKRVIDALRRGCNVECTGQWGNHCNLIQLFKDAARLLAYRCWPCRRLTDPLNSLVNAPPLVIERGGLWLTYDFISCKANTFARALCEYVGSPHVRALEIGSFEGGSSCWFLANVLSHVTSRLICVDSQPMMCPASRLLHRNWTAMGLRERVRFINAPSRGVLRMLATDAPFQIVNIDGSRHPAELMNDARLSWHLLAEGGIMIFSEYISNEPDFCHLLPWWHSVSAVGTVDLFLQEHRGRYRVIHRGFELIVQKQR